ncbi:Multidrug resistance protein 1 [Ancistrocladus abbreviatus]
MSQDSKEIKSVEQWRWSEMQGIELLASNSDPYMPSNPTEGSSISGQTREGNGGEREGREMDVSEGKNDGKDGEKPKEAIPPVAFKELFRFADGLDYILMGIGSVGAFVHGCSLPLFLRFFADLVNSFGSYANNPDKMMQEVLKYAFYFLVVGAAIWASSWAEIACWMWTGERQTTKMRIKYLEAALNQDIQYFDTEVRTSDVVFAINTDAVMVQDAISEKLGNFIHYMATFVSGFVVGFTAVWQLALVTLAVVPLIAIIGAIYTTTLAKLTTKSQDALSQAGNIVEQTVAQIRVVFAFVGESRALQAYSSALKVVQRLGYKSGFSKGLGLGATYFTVFCCYALLLWYGGYLVRHHYTNGGVAIATMFAVMIGGL